MAYFERTDVAYYDSVNLDAFSRLKVSQPVTLFESKHIHQNNDFFWDYKTSGSGSSTYQGDDSSVDLDVTTASGDLSIKQSRQYIPYQPGKSQLIALTGVLDSPKSNLIQRLGYFDSSDGIFLETNGSDINIVRRSSSSSSIVDTQISRSSWNIDPLDGSGKSGINLDLETAIILVIDLEWLGVGRVRVGFDIDGQLYPAHYFNNLNEYTTTYMSTGSLPVRYEIQNTDTTSTSSKFKTICASVSSEGGFYRFGLDFSYGNGTTLRSAGTGGSPLVAIRPKSTFGGKTNRRTIQFTSASFYNQDSTALFQVKHILDPTTSSGGSWVSVGAHSAAEVNTGITSISGGTSTDILSQFLPAKTGGPPASRYQSSSSVSSYFSRHNIITLDIDGNQDELLAVYATTLSGSSDCSSHISWIELE